MTLTEPTTMLPVMEQFLTLQGEGFHTGRAAWFIRLGGCDVGCTWCDVKESWDASDHPRIGIDEIVASVNERFVVITGGEPTMYDLNKLTDALRSAGHELAIETSGTNELTGDWHWICFSPKKFREPVSSIYEQANELKVIVYNKHDLEWALEHAAKVEPECLLYLQPEWDRREEMIPLITAFIKEHPQWRMSLQTHKYLGIP